MKSKHLHHHVKLYRDAMNSVKCNTPGSAKACRQDYGSSDAHAPRVQGNRCETRALEKARRVQALAVVATHERVRQRLNKSMNTGRRSRRFKVFRAGPTLWQRPHTKQSTCHAPPAARVYSCETMPRPQPENELRQRASLRTRRVRSPSQRMLARSSKHTRHSTTAP